MAVSQVWWDNTVTCPGSGGEFELSSELILLRLTAVAADFCISVFEGATLIFWAGV